VQRRCELRDTLTHSRRELAALAKAADIGLHVDCCLGSYMVPFARSIGKRDIPDFDFAVDGVTSISCDTHKYGFAPKGSSVIMWCSPEWRTFQYYSCTSWSGGIYATPTITGSRAGANLAATWAVIRHFGRKGYEEAARRVFSAADVISEGVKAIPGIEQYGSTDHAIVAFGPTRDGSLSPNIYKVATAMSKRGWALNPLQKPACVHICVTYANAPMAEQFVEDLRECVSDVMRDPDAFKGGAAAMYGSTTAMAPAHLLHQVARLYLDTMYKS
jgi:sphinganine-1-phosphate aldolase